MLLAKCEARLAVLRIRILDASVSRTNYASQRPSATAIELAVREAQSNAPGYTYAGFCAKVKAAGCAGYMVSFSGMGRSACVAGEGGIEPSALASKLEPPLPADGRSMR